MHNSLLSKYLFQRCMVGYLIHLILISKITTVKEKYFTDSAYENGEAKKAFATHVYPGTEISPTEFLMYSAREEEMHK